jgi:hypothetical protein
MGKIDENVHKGAGSKSSQDEDAGSNKKKDGGGSTKTSPPAMEKDSHAASPGKSKFYGPTDGNADRNIDLTDADGGGSGESHPYSCDSPFIGETKGNKDRPIDISRGTGGKEGGKYIAGRGNKVFKGNKGGF